MTILFLTAAVLFLAFSNGANDNFKGVATLYGSGRASFRTAILWATITTLAGSALALFMGSHLVATFSGKGLVPDALVGQSTFVMAVAVGASSTVFLATRLGLLVSTTHSLVGGLVGAGLVASGSQVELGNLGSSILLPLMFSPLVATVLTYVLYRLMRSGRIHLGLSPESCACVTATEPLPTGKVPAAPDSSVMAIAARPPIIVHRAGCNARLTGRVVGIDAQAGLDSLHFLSAGAVGFARGLNDTPKIVALLAVGSAMGLQHAVLWVGIVMAIGGLLAARRVAETMSHKITTMNDGQGFSANLVTAGLVLLASRFGLPVSTTHVSVGSLFGIGVVKGAGHWRAVLGILAAWLITLPVSGAIAAIAGLLLM